jgi:hypothetical protein
MRNTEVLCFVKPSVLKDGLLSTVGKKKDRQVIEMETKRDLGNPWSLPARWAGDIVLWQSWQKYEDGCMEFKPLGARLFFITFLSFLCWRVGRMCARKCGKDRVAFQWRIPLLPLDCISCSARDRG